MYLWTFILAINCTQTKNVMKEENVIVRDGHSTKHIVSLQFQRQMRKF